MDRGIRLKERTSIHTNINESVSALEREYKEDINDRKKSKQGFCG